jgi:class 3 adenylate cyclase
MEKYYRERFEAQRRISKNISSSLEVNEILESLREETRNLITSALEVCILLLDPDAHKYTRPLQCALYNRPVNCLSCKKDRAAVIRALSRKKYVVIQKSEDIVRSDGTVIETGPEIAMPVFVNGEILAVIHVVSEPGSRFNRKDFYFLKDMTETVGNAIVKAKKHWEISQEKIKISQTLAQLSQEKQSKEVTVLFLDLEDYTRLSDRYSAKDVNELVEQVFSRFVDPIQRSGGDINETAGDGLMIIFKDDHAENNARSAVRAAFEIYEINRKFSRRLIKKVEFIKVNMGINSGVALLGMTQFKGSLETRMTYTATGPVTNLAARLADYAKGGDILIGEETRKLIEGLWPVYDHGITTLKGIEKPIGIYSLKTPSSKDLD